MPSNFSTSKKEIFEFLSITVLVTKIWTLFFITPFVYFYCLLSTDIILLRILALIYLIWMIIDRDAVHNGGRGLGWIPLRKICRFDGARNYFPVNLIKTTDLSPDRNYLFAVFPHGISSLGVILNFVSLSSKFWTYYQRIRPKVLTLHLTLYVPLIREYTFAHGAASCSARSIKALLSQSNDPNDPINSDGYTSNAAILVVGGIREMLYARPGEYRLIAKSRKGFVKQAIINGSPLVPVFSFGEIDLYDQPPNPPGSLFRSCQEFIKRWFGCPLIIIKGAWFYIPKRKPINTVVGAPIEVIKDENPSERYINEIHEKFLSALIEIFETYKSKYVPDHENVKLILE